MVGKDVEQADIVKKNLQNITDQIASTAKEIGNKVAEGATTGAQAVAEGATTGAQAVGDGVNTAVDQLTNRALAHVTSIFVVLISLLSYLVIHA